MEPRKPEKIQCVTCGRKGVKTPASFGGISWKIPSGWMGSLETPMRGFNCSAQCYYEDAKKHAPGIAEIIGLKRGIVANKRKGEKSAQSEPPVYSGPLFDVDDDA